MNKQQIIRAIQYLENKAELLEDEASCLRVSVIAMREIRDEWKESERVNICRTRS